jgi:hypothetical protein
VSFAEIRFGIELVDDPTRRAQLNDWLTHRIRPVFEGRELAITEDVMVKFPWVRLRAHYAYPNIKQVVAFNLGLF